jgi:hypothetical protein
MWSSETFGQMVSWCSSGGLFHERMIFALLKFSKKCELSSKGRCRQFGRQALLPILLLGTVAFAQSPAAVHGGRAMPRRQVRSGIDDRVRVLAKTLELSEAQQSAVKKILEQRRQQVWQIRQDPVLSGGARIERFRILQAITVEQIRQVLNDEQKKKYDPYAASRLQPAPEQRSVEDWLGAITR